MFFKKNDKQETLQRASKARIISSEFMPIIDKKFSDYVSEAMKKVRSNETSGESLACIISKMICLDDLKNVIKQDINRAEKIEKELLNGNSK